MEPVTLEEAKLYMRIDSDYTDEDALINDLITGEREYLEKALNLSLVTKQLMMVTSGYSRWVELLEGPVIDVLSVIDSDNNAVEYSITGVNFPRLYGYFTDNTSITYNAGYNSTNLPKKIKNELLKRIAVAYDNRGNEDFNIESLKISRQALAFSKNVWL